MNILQDIADKTRRRIVNQRTAVPDEHIIAQAQALAEHERTQGEFTFAFEQALTHDEMAFICELKKASPSKGIIAADFPYRSIARDYEAAGAAAISCLTEPFWFKGSDAYLKEIANEVTIPILRKDFVIDPYMIYEAKVLGASAVLLICSLLDDEELKAYLDLAHSLGMSALVEAHDENEVVRARTAGARIIGVNNRNLTTFKVDTSNALRLREAAGSSVIFVSESGIKTHEDIVHLVQAQVDAVLIGETLMKAPDKQAMLSYLKTGHPTPSTQGGDQA